MTHTGAQPFRITYDSEPLATHVRKRVGWVAECPKCGTVGPVRDKRGVAQWDYLMHRHERHGADK